jgi:hypothetical protein
MPANYGAKKPASTTRPKRKPAMGIKPKPVGGGSGSSGGTAKKKTAKRDYILPGKPKRRPPGTIPTPRDPTKDKWAKADDKKKPAKGTKRTQLPFPKPRGR